MKKQLNIKVCVDNREKIESILTDVQKRSTVRNIDYKDIELVCKKVTNYLNIPKKHMNGVKFTAEPYGEKFASAYKYTPVSTLFTAEFKRGNWYITGMYRGDSLNNDNNVRINLTDEAKESILERMTKCHW